MPITGAGSVMVAERCAASARAIPKSITLTSPDASQHHVRRFDIAVHNAVAVRVVQRSQNPGRDLERPLREQSPTAGK